MKLGCKIVQPNEHHFYIVLSSISVLTPVHCICILWYSMATQSYAGLGFPDLPGMQALHSCNNQGTILFIPVLWADNIEPWSCRAPCRAVNNTSGEIWWWNMVKLSGEIWWWNMMVKYDGETKWWNYGQVVTCLLCGYKRGIQLGIARSAGLNRLIKGRPTTLHNVEFELRMCWLI